jgi:hypothetical protein
MPSTVCSMVRTAARGVWSGSHCSTREHTSGYSQTRRGGRGRFARRVPQLADVRVATTGGHADMKVNTKEFSFDSVFAPEAEQKEIFNAVGKPVLKDVLAGYNGAILAYGQTGAGKTHSLLNNAGGKPAEAGLLPRTVAALFVYVGADAGHVYTVDAAAFQIYNEQVRHSPPVRESVRGVRERVRSCDAPCATLRRRSDVKGCEWMQVDDLLCEDRNQNCNLPVKAGGDVQNLTWVPCKSADELLRLFQKARNNVIYAETKMNKASSRSHSVFQIKVSKRSRVTDAATGAKGAVKMQATFGKLTVVDLAGSERVKKSGVTGVGLKEAANINTSLLAFGNVVQVRPAARGWARFGVGATSLNTGGSAGAFPHCFGSWSTPQPTARVNAPYRVHASPLATGWLMFNGRLSG